MLPLWIIDITKPSARRDSFLDLVKQIDHVRMASFKYSEKRGNDNEGEGEYNSNINNEDVFNVTSPYDEATDQLAKGLKIFTDSDLNSEEERKAARNARIEGDYWYYSSYELESFFDKDVVNTNFTEEDVNTAPEKIKATAECLYKFQEELVKDAKNFIMTLRESNAKPYQPFNVVVLGDVTEEFTQLVFPAIAAIIQKEKGRFLSGHIHQGLSIRGMLYMPCDINARKVQDREKILRLLREIEVQNNISSMIGYDNMMLYQDVHNRTECAYKRLNDNELAEYLIQCIVNIYLACDINHPLLSGTGADDTFYFSMGATSIYFDMTVEDKNDANIVASNLVNIFKENGDNAKTEIEVNLFDKEIFSAEKFVVAVQSDDISIGNDQERRGPNPHPIKDFFHRNLKRLYYEAYLRFFPAELLRDTMQNIEDSTNKQLEKISVHCSSAYKNAELALPPAITRIISRVNKNVGALPFVENKFRDMQEAMSKEKTNIQKAINTQYWNDILNRHDSSFEDYHDTYLNDIRCKNSGSGCNALKKEAIGRLEALLSSEKTLLSVMCHCLLLGVLNVIGILPILKLVSPELINLGNVDKFELFWGLLLFIAPALIQLISHFLYLRKKRNLIHQIKTYYTHDAYARLANRIESEGISYYEKVIKLLDAYLDRCKKIRNEVTIVTPDPSLRLLFPKSKFNQPLNGGEFDNEPLISPSDIESSAIKINYKPEFVNNISREQYYILINYLNNEFGRLFDGVSLIDSHSRRFDEKTGENVFVHDEIEKQMNEQWANIKKQFNCDLFKCIKENMLPRAYPTIGEKLLQYKRKVNNCDLLEYMIRYAATNGELSSQSDTEYADVKMNRNIEELAKSYLPHYTTNWQCSEYDEIFKRYIFITRWKTYKKLALNRLLPEEDFDIATREVRVYSDEVRANERDKNNKELFKTNNVHTKTSVPTTTIDEEENSTILLTSIILWSVCLDDNSNEWLKLFNVEHFHIAFKQRNIFREIMNQND